MKRKSAFNKIVVIYICWNADHSLAAWRNCLAAAGRSIGIAAERHFLNNARASKYKMRFFCFFPIHQLPSVYIFHISPAAQHENEKLADLLLLSTSYIKLLYGR